MSLQYTTCCLLAVALCGTAVADESATAPEAARQTAVALNYCTSAFYRIRRCPSSDVLRQEQRKILNNLNLSAIDDEEVIKLYSAVLDEVGQIQIADRERQVVDTSYDKAWQSMATFGAFSLLTEAADMDYASLIKKGANSWWDFRGLQISRDMDLWKTEKARLTAVLNKSSNFLDASWKLARKRNIPDTWLVRATDLERLDGALAETDPAVRLRLLARMEPFLECYPPYWYYTARTQQQLGRFLDAEKTYGRVAQLGGGHFRRDEMLAATWANVAAIRDFLKMDGPALAAKEALACSSDAWEVNLTAALVLLRHDDVASAEDAVLRNLDAGLETTHSSVALLSVYAKQQDPLKILVRLDDEATVARTPIPVLLRCAAALNNVSLPRPAAERLRTSLYGYFEGRSGQEFVLVSDADWQFDRARFAVDERSFARPTLLPSESVTTVQFHRTAGRPMAGDAFEVLFKYADDFEVKLTLRREPGQEPHRDAQRETAAPLARMGNLFTFTADRRPEPPRRETLRIAVVEAGGTVLAFDGRSRQSVQSAAGTELVLLGSPEPLLTP